MVFGWVRIVFILVVRLGSESSGSVSCDLENFWISVRGFSKRG